MDCGDEKLSKSLTQTFTAHCNAMICQQVTLSGDAEWPKVADAVIEADPHFWRLFGAVFVGGALRGGAQLVQLEAAQAGGIGQVAGGIAATGSQATQQRLGRALDTRPTITVDSGQLCQVLLTKPLRLPAMWPVP